MQTLSQNPNEITHDWYIDSIGQLSNIPMRPHPQHLSQANRLRGDIVAAKTLVQVCTGLDNDLQREIQIAMLIKWLRWHFNVDEKTVFYADIEHLVYDYEIMSMWIGEWNKRELEMQGELSTWHNNKLRQMKRRLDYYNDLAQLRCLLQIETSEMWEKMHSILSFSTTSNSYQSIVCAINRIL